MKEHYFKAEPKYCTQAGELFRSQRKELINRGNKMVQKAKTAQEGLLMNCGIHEGVWG